MVITPWGDSETLRGRRLRPGPGVPRSEVVKNQRERLFAALVVSLSEKGYEATTLKDLARISGVSSRSFYSHFSSKEDCYVAALESIIEAAVRYATQGGSTDAPPPSVAAGNESWEAAARHGFDSFAVMVAAQPAAARMALIESYAVGPRATELIDGAIRGFEWLAKQTLEQSPERAGMPDELIAAHIGAMREIASTRLRRGSESELPKLLDEQWDLIRSYRPPPEPLHLAGRIPGPREEDLDAHDNAERVIRALAVEVAEKGYNRTTIDDVLRRAKMSATTLYDQFASKDDALMGAIDSAGAQMYAAALPPLEQADDWASGMRAAYGAVLSFLASRPALARLVMVEIYAAGPAAVERRTEALAPWRGLVERGFDVAPEIPPITPEVIGGGQYTLAYRQIKAKGPAELPRLAPIFTYIALSPFVGPQRACELANEVRRRRG
jgi:AcrR family transcriptional regulator